MGAEPKIFPAFALDYVSMLQIRSPIKCLAPDWLHSGAHQLLVLHTYVRHGDGGLGAKLNSGTCICVHLTGYYSTVKLSSYCRYSQQVFHAHEQVGFITAHGHLTRSQKALDLWQSQLLLLT